MVKDGIIETSVVVKESKIPNYWSSAVPKKYKINAILGDLHWANKFQVILCMKNSILGKNILALISHTVSFSLLLFLISKNANLYLLTGYLKKDIGKQFTLEYVFVN